MISREELANARRRAAGFLRRAGIVLSPADRRNIEVADFGLGDLKNTGLEIVTYVNTERCCAKELVLFPRQTCPEHRHPPQSTTDTGKEETFRCRWGTVYLYLPGRKTAKPHARPPKGTEQYYTVWNEIVLRPGQQHTLPPDTLHWFQSGPHGAILSEFSTHSRDETDVFTNPAIQRATRVR